MLQKSIKIIFFFLFSVQLISFTQAQVVDPRIRKINQQIDILNNSYLQQKIFLQFDQAYYTTSDVIQFKAFVLNNSTLEPDTISTNLYVEIINSEGVLKHIRILRLQKGLALARIELNDTLLAGVYLFRAYTNWSRNFGSKSFYEKYVLIAPNNTTKEQIKSFVNILPEKKKTKTTVEFYSEGGHFINGLQNHIYARIKYSDIVKEIKESFIYNSENILIDTVIFKNGLADFFFLANKGEKYYLKLKSKEKYLKFTFPEFEDKGYVINSNYNLEKDSINVKVETNVDKTVDDYANSMFLLVQRSEQKQLLRKNILNNKQTEFNISISDMPYGLLLFTFLDNDLNTVSERIFFHSPKNIKYIIPVKKEIQNDSLILTFKTNNAIPEYNTIFKKTTNPELAHKMSMSMQNYLWLKTDLPDIDNNICMMDITKNGSCEILNNYLAGEKWKRFSVKDVINNNFPVINFKREHYLVVSGKILRQYIKLPLSNSPVELTVLNEFHFSQKDTTDEFGTFYFDGIDYEDTISVKIIARRWINDKENVLITLDEGNLPDTDFNKNNILFSWFKTTYKKEYRKMRFASRNPEYRPDTADDGHYRLYKRADYVLKVNNQNSSTYTSVLDLLRGRVPGLNIMGSGPSARITIRGVSSLYGSNEPLYLIDGMEVNRSTFNSISPNDVDKVEVITGGQSAIYGSRGSNGIIALYTKKGIKVIKGKAIFDMLGYQNVKNNNDLLNSKLFGKSIQCWNPLPVIEKNGNYYFKLPYNSNNQFYIEQISNGIPCSYEVKE